MATCTFQRCFSTVKSVQITASIVVFLFICCLCSTLGIVLVHSFYHYYATRFTFSLFRHFPYFLLLKNMITKGRVKALSCSNFLSVLHEQRSLELSLPSCNRNPHITSQQSELYCASFTWPVTLNHPGHLSFLHLTFSVT